MPNLGKDKLMDYTINFPTGSTEYYIDCSISKMLQLAPANNTIIITDENVARHFIQLFDGYKTLVVVAGEESKTLDTITLLAEKLIEHDAHKSTLILGVGGGMICDLCGFLSSVYMRGISFGFVPTTLLAMVDAAIGGKNGVNFGLNKNMLGLINQPKFIAFNTVFLSTLPSQEWSSGFAEIIKYACITDEPLWHQLRSKCLGDFQKDNVLLSNTINQCIQHKNRIVLADEQEKSLRKTLNFGHTAGHAFETIYSLQHGQAVAFGMIVALIASEQNLNLPKEIRPQFIGMLQNYELLTTLCFDVEKVMHTLKHDKKRNNETIDFILLKSMGKAQIIPLGLGAIKQALQTFADECSC